jgi:hypothetical protein
MAGRRAEKLAMSPIIGPATAGATPEVFSFFLTGLGFPVVSTIGMVLVLVFRHLFELNHELVQHEEGIVMVGEV